MRTIELYRQAFPELADDEIRELEELATAEEESKNKFDAAKNTGPIGDVVDSFQSGALTASADITRGFTLGQENTFSKGLRDWANSQYKTMRPEAIDALNNTGFNDDGSLKKRSSMLGGAMLLSQIAGGFVPSFVPGLAIAGGLSKVQKLNKYSEVIGHGLGGLLLTGGSTSNQAAEEAMKASPEQLAESVGFKDLYWKYIDQELGQTDAFNRAREEYIGNLATEGFVKGGLVGFTTIGPGNTVLSKVMRNKLGNGGTSRISNTIQGIGAESIPEYIEGYSQKVITNTIAQDYDKDRKTYEGAVGDGLTGAVGGVPFGGAIGFAGSFNKDRIPSGSKDKDTEYRSNNDSGDVSEDIQNNPKPQYAEDILNDNPKPQYAEDIPSENPKPQYAEDILNDNPKPQYAEDIPSENPKPQYAEDILNDNPKPQYAEDIPSENPKPQYAEDILNENSDLNKREYRDNETPLPLQPQAPEHQQEPNTIIDSNPPKVTATNKIKRINSAIKRKIKELEKNTNTGEKQQEIKQKISSMSQLVSKIAKSSIDEIANNLNPIQSALNESGYSIDTANKISTHIENMPFYSKEEWKEYIKTAPDNEADYLNYYHDIDVIANNLKPIQSELNESGYSIDTANKISTHIENMPFYSKEEWKEYIKTAPENEADYLNYYHDFEPITTEKEKENISKQNKKIKKTATVFTSNNDSVDVEYDVVESSDIISSHDKTGKANPLFPAELQPRDRSGKKSQIQIQSIAAKLEPTRLGSSQNSQDGAPIIGADNVVDSGNGRIEAIKLSGRNGNTSYQKWLKSNAAEFGINKNTINSMTDPILVRRRTTKMNKKQRLKFVSDSNRSNVADLNPLELAKIDAKLIDDNLISVFSKNKDGNVLSASNQSFLKGFAENIGANDTSGLITSDGKWTKKMSDRVQASVFHYAFQNDKLTSILAQDADPTISNIIKALNQNASAFAKINAKGAKDSGYDVTPKIVEAIDIILKSKESGTTVDELIKQTDIFGDLDKDSANIAKLINFNSRSSKKIAEFFSKVVSSIENQLDHSKNEDIFGGSHRSVSSIISTLTNTGTGTTDIAVKNEDKDSKPKISPEINISKNRFDRKSVNADQLKKIVKPELKSTQKIKDFGEVLSGARKDLHTKLIEDIDIKKESLSDSFPLPDYEKMVADGMDAELVTVISQIRAAIKPKKRTRISQVWIDSVVDARREVAELLSGVKKASEYYGKADKILGGMSLLAKIGKDILPSQIKHLAKIRLSTGIGRKYELDPQGQLKRGTRDRKVWTISYVNNYRNEFSFFSEKEAIAKIKEMVADASVSKNKRQTTFNIWNKVGKKGVFLGKKIAAGKFVELKHFETKKEAIDYRNNNYNELIDLLKKKKEVRDVRRADNNQRVGIEHNKGLDVTPELFQETFGFRGVQFGNWIEGDRRQQDLNNAFNALMDLSLVLNVPEKSLSLNGSLGLAFGARGRGGKNAAAAHFEPGSVNINLTKINGRGSLAHELFHAFDDYFGTEAGLDGYLTESKGSDNNGVRKKVFEAWQGITKAIKEETNLAARSKKLDKTRAKDYWSTTREMTARSFERYVIGKIKDNKGSNDYLANIVSEQAHSAENDTLVSNEEYAYPLDSEMKVINSAYDKLFKTLKSKETDKGVALFSLSDKTNKDNIKLSLSDKKHLDTLNNDKNVLSFIGEIKKEHKINDDNLPFSIVDANGIYNDISKAFKEVFKTETIFVKPTNEKFSFFRGANLPSGATAINVDKIKEENFNLVSLTGHELLHSIKRENPEIYSWFEAKALRHLKTGELKKYKNHLQKLGDSKAESDKHVLEEMIADFAGDSLSDVKFLKTLARSNPSRFRELLNTIIKFYQDVKIKLKNFGSYDYFNSVEQLQDNLKHVLNQFNKDGVKGIKDVKFSSSSNTIKPLGKIDQKAQANESQVMFSQTKTNHAGQSDLFGHKKTKNPKTGGIEWSAPELTRFEEFRRFIENRMVSVKKTQKEITSRGGEIKDDSNIIFAEAAYHGKVENDLLELNNRHLHPIFKTMSEKGISPNLIDIYAVAKHAPERNIYIASINQELQDGGIGMKTKPANDLVAKIEKSPLGNDIKKIHKALLNITKITHFYRKEYGLLSKTHQYKNDWEYYVPVKGIDYDETKKTMPRTGKGFSISGKESIASLGRKSMPESPLYNIQNDAIEAIIRARQNEVDESLYNLVNDYPNKKYWEIFTDENPDKIRAINKSGEVVMKKMVMSQEVKNKNSSYIPLKINGEQIYIKINDVDFLRAMKALGVENGGKFIQAMGSMTRFLAWASTAANVDFIGPNGIRDVQAAILNILSEVDLKDSRTDGKNLLPAMALNYKSTYSVIYRYTRNKKAKDKNQQKMFDKYKMFLEGGGKTGYFDSPSLKQIEKSTKKVMDMYAGGVKGNTKKATHEALQFIEDINTTVENAVRFSAYVAAIDAGISHKKAIFLAKNLTINFNQKGEASPVINALYIFFTAAVQSASTFSRAMLTPKQVEKSLPLIGNKRLNLGQKAASGLIVFGYISAEFAKLTSDEDDDGVLFYDKVEDYVRKMNVTIMKPDGKNYNLIPLSHGYNMFYVLGTLISDIKSGSKSILQASSFMLGTLADSFIPLSLSDSDEMATYLAKPLVPTVPKPLIDLAVNENFFGGNIHKKSFSDKYKKPASSQGKRGTGDFWIGISKFLNTATNGNEHISGGIDLYPETLKYIADFVGGGAGKSVFKSYETLENLLKGDISEMDHRRIVIWSRFSGGYTPYKDHAKFRERQSRLWQYYDLLKNSKKRSLVRKTYSNELLMYINSKITQKSIKIVWGKIDRVNLSNLTENKKRLKIDKLKLEVKQHIDKFNKEYNALFKE